MTTLKLNLNKQEDNSYKIHIENNLLTKIPKILSKERYGKKYAIICDSNTTRLFGTKLLKALKPNSNDNNSKSILITFSAGDKSKNFRVIETILNELTINNFSRDSAIIALGGGVTGDIAGFASSIYMRGIPYIQIPTTLLAMCDSSVGGKTGINLKAGKNLAGTFYQPKAVFIDPTTLKSLPKTEFLNGLSEVLKYGIIKDKKLFELIEKATLKAEIDDEKFLNTIITRSCEIKAEIVSADEKEQGIRKSLNYGHTFGHALETISSHRISHGQAIAIGMKLINKISVAKNFMSTKDEQRIHSLINKLELCGKHKISTNPNYAEKLWTIIKKDKKNLNNQIHFVIAEKIGKTKITTNITKQDLFNALLKYD